MAAKLVI